MNADADRRKFYRIGAAMLGTVVVLSACLILTAGGVGTMVGNVLVALALGFVVWLGWEWRNPFEWEHLDPIPYVLVESPEFTRAADEALEVARP